MSAISYKNFAYIKGPKGDRGPKGDPGPKGDRGESGVVSVTGRITYNPVTKTIGFNEVGLINELAVPTSLNDLTDVDTETFVPSDGQLLAWDSAIDKWRPAGAIDGGFYGPEAEAGTVVLTYYV